MSRAERVEYCFSHSKAPNMKKRGDKPSESLEINGDVAQMRDKKKQDKFTQQKESSPRRCKV